MVGVASPAEGKQERQLNERIWMGRSRFGWVDSGQIRAVVAWIQGWQIFLTLRALALLHKVPHYTREYTFARASVVGQRIDSGTCGEA